MYYLGSGEEGGIEDEFGSWQLVYGSDKSCEERVIQAGYKNNVSPLDDMVTERRFVQNDRRYRKPTLQHVDPAAHNPTTNPTQQARVLGATHSLQH